MKIVVDKNLCEGNMRCVEVAPEIFEVRDDDRAHVLIENPAPGFKPKVQLAVKMCPRQAISVIED